MTRRVPILTYHSLDDSGSVISLAPRVFERQQRELATRGFTGIALEHLLTGWDGEVELPDHPVVLTFDDGFSNVFEVAAPILEELGFGATVFPVAGWLGRRNDWPSQPVGIPRLPLMDGESLKCWVAQGFEVGAHTVNHSLLPRLGQEELDFEVLEGRNRLEDLLGVAVRTFAYPYGSFDSRVLRSVESAFDAACTVRLAVAQCSDGRQCLPRLDMYYFRGSGTWDLVGTRRGKAYLTLRALARRVRALGPRGLR